MEAAAPRTEAGHDLHASLCVLGSGSRGNCSILRSPAPGGGERLIMIDAGLSPRRTAALLEGLGLQMNQVDGVIFTHLDCDHFQPAWVRALPAHARVYVHRSHRSRAEAGGLLYRRAVLFSDTAEITLSPPEGSRDRPGFAATCVTNAHDDLGSVAFRFSFAGGGDLGYATDLGCAGDELLGCLAGVSTLAIESNYCPEMQRASDRPAFLKRRITGGRGHLSNHESADAARRIDPARRLVLLHLSSECNTPELAAAAHARMRDRGPVISLQDAPTPWISLEPAAPRPPRICQTQASLFDAALAR